MILLLLAVCLLDSQAQEPTDTGELEQRMKAIEADLDRLQGAIRNVDRTKHKISDEITQLELERAVLNTQIERAELQIEMAESEIQRIESQRSDLQGRIEAQKQAIAQGLRRLYKRGKLGYLHVLLKQSRLDELLTAFHYARHMTERDHKAFVAFRETHRQLGLVTDALRSAREEGESARAEQAAKRKKLDQLLNKRNQRLRQIQSERKQKLALAQELQLERDELDVMIKRLLNDNDAESFRIPIARYKGRLTWPAQGTIKRRFGIIHDPEFNTKRRQNGIDIALERDTPVRAIFGGRVIYADWFKSYGNLIILDHGDQITSFYAHNNRLLVSKGDAVERDQIIARSGDTGSLEGPFLHFEIRLDGQPKDPKSWLKKQ